MTTDLLMSELMTVSDKPLPKAPPGFVIRAALGLHRFFARLSRAVLPGEVLALDAVLGAPKTEVVGALARLGVFDALDAPATAEALAVRLGLDGDRLFRVLRAAAHLGILALDKAGTFRLTRVGRALRRDHPSHMRDFAVYFASRSNLEAWARVEDVVKKGGNGFQHAFGTDVWTWFERHPDERETFARAMMGLTFADAPFIASMFPWSEAKVVCDVGGGRGSLLSELLLRHAHLCGVLVDAPGVLASARGLLARRGVEARVTLAPGSFFEAVPEGADTYVLKNILHDWGDDTCVDILRVVRRAMKPGARVLVAESLLGRYDAKDFAALADVQMMVACVDGRERSREELVALLRAAGFEPGRVFAAPTIGLVEGLAS